MLGYGKLDKKIKIEFLNKSAGNANKEKWVLSGKSKSSYALTNQKKLEILYNEKIQPIKRYNPTKFLKLWNFGEYYLTLTEDQKLVRIYLKDGQISVKKLKIEIPRIPEKDPLFCTLKDGNHSKKALICTGYNSIHILEKVKNMKFRNLRKTNNEIRKIFNLINNEFAIIEGEDPIGIKILKIDFRNFKILKQKFLNTGGIENYFEVKDIKQNKTGKIFFVLISSYYGIHELKIEYKIMIFEDINGFMMKICEKDLPIFEEINCFDVVSETNELCFLVFYGIYGRYVSFTPAHFDKNLGFFYDYNDEFYKTPVCDLKEFVKFEKEVREGEECLFGVDGYKKVIKVTYC